MKPKNIPIKDWRQLIFYLFFFEQGGCFLVCWVCNSLSGNAYLYLYVFISFYFSNGWF
jgi:hypothetical protein